jgi:hypothetical protein
MTIHQHPQQTQAEARPTNSRTSKSSPLRIEKLRTRAAPLDMTSGQFRSLGHDLVDRIADFLASIRTHPVTRAESRRKYARPYSRSARYRRRGRTQSPCYARPPLCYLNTRFSTAIRASMVTSHPAPPLLVCWRTCWQLP